MMRPLCVFGELNGTYLLSLRYSRYTYSRGVVFVGNCSYLLYPEGTPDIPKPEGTIRILRSPVQRCVSVYLPAQDCFVGRLRIPSELLDDNSVWVLVYDIDRDMFLNTLFASDDVINRVVEWAKGQGLPVKAYSGYAEVSFTEG